MFVKLNKLNAKKKKLLIEEKPIFSSYFISLRAYL